MTSNVRLMAELALTNDKERRTKARLDHLNSLVSGNFMSGARSNRALVLAIGRLGLPALNKARVPTVEVVSFTIPDVPYFDPHKDSYVASRLLAVGRIVLGHDPNIGQANELIWQADGKVAHSHVEAVGPSGEAERIYLVLDDDPSNPRDVWTLNPDMRTLDVQIGPFSGNSVSERLYWAQLGIGEYDSAMAMFDYLAQHRALTKALVEEIDAAVAADKV